MTRDNKWGLHSGDTHFVISSTVHCTIVWERMKTCESTNYDQISAGICVPIAHVNMSCKDQSNDWSSVIWLYSILSVIYSYVLLLHSERKRNRGREANILSCGKVHKGPIISLDLDLESLHQDAECPPGSYFLQCMLTKMNLEALMYLNIV